MSRIEVIKAAQLTARKARNEVERSLLTTFIGEAEMIGKNARNGAPTDEEVVSLLKKFEKNLLEVIELTKNAQACSVVQYREELEIIKRFLPAKLTDLQVQKDIGTAMEKLGLAKEQKSMGAIVKELKAKYGDQFDGGQVSAQFKAMLV